MKIFYNKVKVVNVWDKGQRREDFSSSKKHKWGRSTVGKKWFCDGKRPDKTRQKQSEFHLVTKDDDRKKRGL